MGTPKNLPIEERFMLYVCPDPNSGCWLWSGADDGNGYGLFGVSNDNRSEKAHRVSYKLFKGKISKGLVLDHLCRVRCCVNPEHLEQVTMRENNRRGLNGILRIPQSHCKRGHKLSGENLYTHKKDGRRGCRACRKMASKAYYEKKKHGN